MSNQCGRQQIPQKKNEQRKKIIFVYQINRGEKDKNSYYYLKYWKAILIPWPKINYFEKCKPLTN